MLFVLLLVFLDWVHCMLMALLVVAVVLFVVAVVAVFVAVVLGSLRPRLS